MIFFCLQANYMDYFKARDEMKKEYPAYYEQSLSKKFKGDKDNISEYPIISQNVANLVWIEMKRKLPWAIICLHRLNCW